MSLGVPENIAAVTGMGIVTILGTIITTVRANKRRARIQKEDSLDDRPPVLFLRAFKTDDLSIKESEKKSLGRFIGGTPLFSWNIGKVTMTDFLVPQLRRTFGPVILAHNQKSMFVAPEAHSFKLERTWTSAVWEMIELSQLIVLELESTEGLKTELGLLRKNNRPKVVFFFGRPDGLRESAYSEFRDYAETVDIELPTSMPQGGFVMAFDEHWSAKFAAENLTMPSDYITVLSNCIKG